MVGITVKPTNGIDDKIRCLFTLCILMRIFSQINAIHGYFIRDSGFTRSTADHIQ
jgi:hypothetical protein